MARQNMKPITRRLLYWSPRVLGIIFILFISLFSLDVFQEGRGVQETAIAFMMHSIPTAMAAVPLLLAWRWAWAGAVVYLGLTIFYVCLTWEKFPLMTYVFMCGPLLIMSGLFWLNWIFREQLKIRS